MLAYRPQFCQKWAHLEDKGRNMGLSRNPENRSIFGIIEAFFKKMMFIDLNCASKYFLRPPECIQLLIKCYFGLNSQKYQFFNSARFFLKIDHCVTVVRIKFCMRALKFRFEANYTPIYTIIDKIRAGSCCKLGLKTR